MANTNGKAQPVDINGQYSVLPPDFTFIMPSGEIVRGRVWMISDSQFVEHGHSFNAGWDMITSARGHSLRWVLIEDV